MLRLPVISALVLTCSLLLSFTIFSPAPTLAVDAVVSGETCTAVDLVAAIDTVGATSGTVTFECENPLIKIDEMILIEEQIVTIDGSNSGNQIILDGQDKTRIIGVTSNDNSVTIRNMTLQNGSDSVEGGGAILNAGTLTVIQSTFTSNWAQFSGGAILNYGGMLTISQSSFTSNHAEGNGGAIINYFSTSDLIITDSSFTSNTADTSGGAIQNEGTLTVSQSSFTTNSTDDFGGAIDTRDGKTTINQSSFTLNSATFSGGAIETVDTALSVSQSSFADNSSKYGGAIYYYRGKTAITSSTFTGNTATLGGSTVFVHPDGADAAIRWSTIVQPENTIPALKLEGTLILEGVILGGEDEHCAFEGGTLTDSYTLANSTTCGLDGTGSRQGQNQNLGLGALKTATINDITQTYYPLLENSPALNAGPASCDTDILEGPDPDQLGNPRPVGANCNIGAIEADNIPPTVTTVSPPPAPIYEGVPTSITITATDQNVNDTFTYACDSGDGSELTFTASSTVACTFPDNGTYTGKAVVFDGTAYDSQTFTVEVRNVSPTMTPLTANPSLVATNQPVTIQTTATDVPADSLTFILSCSNTDSKTIGPSSSPIGIVPFTGTCQYTETGYRVISARVTDDDNGGSNFRFVPIQVVNPTTLCANQWNGSLTVNDDCSRSETELTLPQDGPITLCVTNWNGSARMSHRCSRSEYEITVAGDNTIPTCINTWNGALRISDRCTHSETQHWL